MIIAEGLRRLGIKRIKTILDGQNPTNMVGTVQKNSGGEGGFEPPVQVLARTTV
jgi:hypothetical protein